MSYIFFFKIKLFNTSPTSVMSIILTWCLLQEPMYSLLLVQPTGHLLGVKVILSAPFSFVTCSLQDYIAQAIYLGVGYDLGSFP